MGNRGIIWSRFIFSLIIAIMLWEMVRAEKVIPDEPKPEPKLNYIIVDDFEKVESEPIEPVEPEIDEHELYWLARIISAEARGESVEGQVAVGNVVLNRVEHGEFPNSIKEVIFQERQFSPVSSGTIWNEPTIEAVESATMVLSGERVVGESVLFFYNSKVVSRGSWVRTRPINQVIGNHTFCD